jgi:uncharacterized protein (TIGR04255 family)
VAKFLPFAGKNSIAEMNIGIQFALPFDPKIADSLEAIKAEFSAVFPKFEPLQMITINLGPQFPMPVANPPSTINGFSLVKVKADGSPARVLRVVTNVLSVHFLEYTSWKETKPQAIDYISRCLAKLNSLDHNPATGVLLRYIDRFTFDGASESATADKLFRSDTKFVAARILNGGYQWHCNSGWFERTTADLNQLNVSSGMVQSAVSVIVDHNSVYNFPAPCASLAGLTQGNNERPSLEATLEQQHAANASMLRNLLNKEMLDTIGLKE